ncbi:MAG: hypothetical protein BWY68_00560 [bacterium ADurb.Bin400]|nr:MAG: hypothetical protein BWY68_00560 [bacterium ADurb.Bin400]
MLYLIALLGFVLLPWAVGVIQLFRMVFSSKTTSVESKQQLAKELRGKVLLIKDDGERKGYLMAADYLDGKPVFETSETAAPIGVMESGQPSAKTSVMKTTAIQPAKLAEKNHTSTFSLLENINVLLYLGSFLVVIAASIFIGYNYESLSGLAKTVLLGLFALIFYVSGITLFIKIPKLKPAGLTYTVIGQILIPLVGLAAYRYILNEQDGNTIWFLTSVLTLLFYTLSLTIVRKTYLAYMVSFAALSLFNSAISLFEAPIYYLAWGMAIFPLIWMAVSRIKDLDGTSAGAFRTSSNLILPLSLVFSLLLGAEFGWWQIGVNLIIGSLYYCLVGSLSTDKGSQELNHVISAVIFPLGLILVLTDKGVSLGWELVIMNAVAVVYLLLSEYLLKRSDNTRAKSIALLGGTISALSTFLACSNSSLLAISIIMAFAINGWAYYRGREIFNYTLSLFALMILPYIVMVRDAVVPASDSQMAIIYAVIAVTMFGIRILIGEWHDKSRWVSAPAYLISIVTVIIYAAMSSSQYSLIIAYLFAAAALLYASYLEEEGAILLPSAALLYLAIIRWVGAAQLETLWYPTMISLTGIALYTVGGTIEASDAKRGSYVVYAGLAGTYFAAINFGYWGVKEIYPIISLFLAGTLSYHRSTKAQQPIAQYLSAAIIVLAAEWLLRYWNVQETQFYTLIWAAYFAVLAYMYSLKGENTNRDWLAAISLGFLTIPLFFQASAPDGHMYGLILGVESVALILAGIALAYRLLIQWGSVALIIIVLHETKDILYALPKWLIIGGVGMALLSAATYLLLNRHSQEE